MCWLKAQSWIWNGMMFSLQGWDVDFNPAPKSSVKTKELCYRKFKKSRTSSEDPSIWDKDYLVPQIDFSLSFGHVGESALTWPRFMIAQSSNRFRRKSEKALINLLFVGQGNITSHQSPFTTTAVAHYKSTSNFGFLDDNVIWWSNEKWHTTFGTTLTLPYYHLPVTIYHKFCGSL